MSGVALETRMGLKAVYSLELLIKAARSTGPFGGVSIESVSLSDILKKGEEEADVIQKRKGGFGRAEPSLGKLIKVYFEDKYEKTKKTLIEEYRVELRQIPEDLNGFEFLCHPHLEKEENLIRYFKNWLSSTLASMYYLLQNSPLSAYFLNPASGEEREVANELRKRYNLAVESVEVDASSSPKDAEKGISSVSRLENVLKTRHDIKKALIKLTVSNLRDYKDIINDLKSAQKDMMQSGVSQQRGAATNKRNRFFSDEIPEHALWNKKLRNETRAGAVSSKLSIGSNNDSMDLSTSYRSSGPRPFKVQDGGMTPVGGFPEQFVPHHARRTSAVGSMGEGSISNMYRKRSI
jgi:hypothetical protein